MKYKFVEKLLPKLHGIWKVRFVNEGNLTFKFVPTRMDRK